MNATGLLSGNANDAVYVGLVKPVIETPPADQTVVAGSPANFACTASGNPHPRVTWLKGGIPLSNTDKRTINGGLLAVLSTSVDDTGSYTCLASNTVTNMTETIDFSASATAQLTVLGAVGTCYVKS